MKQPSRTVCERRRKDLAPAKPEEDSVYYTTKVKKMKNKGIEISTPLFLSFHTMTSINVGFTLQLKWNHGYMSFFKIFCSRRRLLRQMCKAKSHVAQPVTSTLIM